METNKDQTPEGKQADPQQAIADRDAPINPFREANAAEPQKTAEEETALEQQRKEALTERD